MTTKDRNPEDELAKAERFDYERLKKQEERGLEAERALKDTKPMSAERVAYHIGGLSPHNLPTTGVWAIESYARQEVLAARKDELDEAFVRNSPAFVEEIDLERYWNEYYEKRLATLKKEKNHG